MAFSASTFFHKSSHTHTTFLPLREPDPPTKITIRPSFSPQFAQKSLFSPLRYKGASLIGVNSQRFSVQVKASMAETAKLEKKNVGVFEKEELPVALAQYVADLSNKFTKERGALTVVLSGGSLIKYMRKLVEPPYVDSIEWSKWHVFWVDERVVPKSHEDSNYKLAYDGFLSKVPIPAGNVYAINDTLSAEGAADDYEKCLRRLVNNNVIAALSASGFPKFDLMLLGMGPDGHIASLFPGHPLVKEDKKWVTFIKDSPKPPPERITFTFPVINSSSCIAFVITGAGKSGAVHSALGGVQNSDKLPVELCQPEGELKWFLDKGAASKL